MTINQKLGYGGMAVIVGCLLVLIGRAWTVSSVDDSPGTKLTEAQQRAIGQALARREPAFRRDAERRFPGDVWSQDDHFHNLEQRWARRVAAKHGVPLIEVLRAIDEDLRTNKRTDPLRRATAAPCKPRPFYD